MDIADLLILSSTVLLIGGLIGRQIDLRSRLKHKRAYSGRHRRDV